MYFFTGALIMFCIRLYLNDLYVSIPDRLLITCALAQTLHNVPVEALIAEGNMWDASPYIKLLDDLSKFILVSSLFLFWLIYTKDKVSYLFIIILQGVQYGLETLSKRANNTVTLFLMSDIFPPSFLCWKHVYILISGVKTF